MRRVASILIVALFVFGLVGIAVAKQLTGTVTAIDKGAGSITVEKKKVETSFDCEGSLLKRIKVGDKVTVYYKVEDGKKVASKIKKKKKKAAIGC